MTRTLMLAVCLVGIVGAGAGCNLCGSESKPPTAEDLKAEIDATPLQLQPIPIAEGEAAPQAGYFLTPEAFQMIDPIMEDLYGKETNAPLASDVSGAEF